MLLNRYTPTGKWGKGKTTGELRVLGGSLDIHTKVLKDAKLTDNVNIITVTRDEYLMLRSWFEREKGQSNGNGNLL